MKNWIFKKIKTIFIVAAFSAAFLGISINTANAVSIEEEIAQALNVPLNYIPNNINDIPAILYAPNPHPDQTERILNNIVGDTMVVEAVKKIRRADEALQAAQNACDIDLVCLTKNGAKYDALLAAKDTLASTIEDLGTALLNARNRQDGLIDSYIKQNEVEDMVNNKVNDITKGTETSQQDFSDQAQEDLAQQNPPGAPTAPPRTNPSEWMAGDQLKTTMQEECVVYAVNKPTNLTPCVALLAYAIVYKPASYALVGSGYIFDKILSLSIEGATVKPPFIESSWKVVRDFSNMLFIFILLYAGTMTIFGAMDWKKVILQVVVIALLINFSLFFTEVVIDAGNILAVGIKSSISPGLSISEGLSAAFQPQQFLKTAGGTGDTTGASAIIVFLVAAVVSLFAAYVFFKASLLFMGRLIAFWFLMIISPFAFISTALPKGNKFNAWFDTLLGQAFIAPVFLFFIYLIMKVLSADGGILSSFTKTDAGWFEFLLGPVIVATLLIVSLQKALDFATSMSGEIGKFGADLTGKVLGTAAGIATGGAALVGQKTLGRAALSLSQNDRFKEVAAKSRAMQLAYNLTDKTANATFDVRNAPAIGSHISSSLGAGKGSAGSFTKTIAAAKAETLAFEKKIATGVDGKAIKIMAPEYKKDDSGNLVKTGKMVEKTTSQAYAERAGTGTVLGKITGENIGRKEAADEIIKKKQKIEKLAKKERDEVEYLRGVLGISETEELDSEAAKAAKKATLDKLEHELARAEANLASIKELDPHNTGAVAQEIINKKRAEKALSKFEKAEATIEKIQQEKKKESEDK